MSVQELPQQTKRSWKTTALNELGQLFCGQSPASSMVNTDGMGTLYVTGPDQWDGYKIRQDKWTTDPKRLVPDGCIFITVKGAGVGKIFPGISCAIGRDVYAFKPSTGFSAKFIEHAIRFTVQDVLRHAAGDIPGLSKAHILQHEVGLPELQEQERIVAEIEKQFSRLDEAVRNLKRVKANLKRYKAAVLQAAVEGNLTEDWRKQHPNVEPARKLLERILGERRATWKGSGRYKEPASPNFSDLPNPPDGWVWASAVQSCDAVVDCHNKTAPYTSTGIPLVRTSNIRDGKLVLEDVRYVDQPTYAFWSRRCLPKPGDVLFTREAPMGEAAIIPPGINLCMGQRIMLMRPSGAITAQFLLYALVSAVIKRIIDMTAVGSGVKHLRVRDVELLPIPVPSKAEQDQIVAEVERRLSVIEELEATVGANLTRADRLRQSVLQQAFSGGFK